ncbi:MAG: glycosyltransferase [Candidatus Bathyarchaeota archaeon]|nr:glycosyltransferase [Candidatus Bathyarchaeota archaeon]
MPARPLLKKIVIATHYHIYGAPQALKDYLIDNRVKQLIFIAHPLRTDGSKSYVEHIVDGDIKGKRVSLIRTNISFFNYFLEMILSFKWVYSKRGKLNLWIGVDPLNAFLGVILKKTNRVEKVIFYTIDYVPFRFNNKILNNLYHWMDRFCLKNADETWNVSPRIAEGRETIRGLRQSVYNRQKVVPIGVWFDRVKKLPFDKIKKHQLFFLGSLLEKQGVQLVLDAIPEIIKRIPDFHFLIVGGGNYEGVLREKVERLNLEKYVTFTGWIKDRDKLDQIMSESALAIAMYDREKDNVTYFADPTKLKDYSSAGLPVLLTDVPHNAKELQERRCGFIIEYDKEKIANAVISFMKDQKILKEYRENAVNYAKQFDWKIIFDSNLEKIL